MIFEGTELLIVRRDAFTGQVKDITCRDCNGRLIWTLGKRSAKCVGVPSRAAGCGVEPINVDPTGTCAACALVQHENWHSTPPMEDF